MIKTDVSDFNLWFVSLYSSRAFLVAGRFWDLDKERWEMLSCLWMARNGFFELKDDRYVTETAVRYKSVDALVAEVDPEMTPTAQHLYNQWMGIKKKLEESRKDKPIPIDPPTPTPTPLPIPDPIPEPKPEEPKPKSKIPWKTIAAVLSAISFALTFFPVPGIVKEIITWIVKILQSIPS